MGRFWQVGWYQAEEDNSGTMKVRDSQDVPYSHGRMHHVSREEQSPTVFWGQREMPEQKQDYCAPNSSGFLGVSRENWSQGNFGLTFPGRKAMTTLDSILKSRDITLSTKVCIVRVMGFPAVMYKCESWNHKEGWVPKNWCFQTVVLEKTLESPLDRKEIEQDNPYGNWKGWCWSSNTLATWCKELTHWKRPWYWERLRAGGEGGNRGWDGWMASLTQWTWVWANSRRVKDSESWHAAVHEVTKSQTWLSDWTTNVLQLRKGTGRGQEKQAGKGGHSIALQPLYVLQSGGK